MAKELPAQIHSTDPSELLQWLRSIVTYSVHITRKYIWQCFSISCIGMEPLEHLDC